MKRLSLPFCLISTLLFTSFDTSLADFKAEFLARINEVRAKGCRCGDTDRPPVPPLVWNDWLARAAYFHADDQYQNHYFSHQSKNGNKLKDRLLQAGYNLTAYRTYTIGENIAFGQKSIKEVTNDWFKSEHHCDNLMSAKFKEVGVSRVGYYWVQDFGGRTF